jgi:hypothetical protein
MPLQAAASARVLHPGACMRVLQPSLTALAPRPNKKGALNHKLLQAKPFPPASLSYDAPKRARFRSKKESAQARSPSTAARSYCRVLGMDAKMAMLFKAYGEKEGGRLFISALRMFGLLEWGACMLHALGMDAKMTMLFRDCEGTRGAEADPCLGICTLRALGMDAQMATDQPPSGSLSNTSTQSSSAGSCPLQICSQSPHSCTELSMAPSLLLFPPPRERPCIENSVPFRP